MADEDRESTSNNRVKSGYEDRPRAPIERVPDAGSVPVSDVLHTSCPPPIPRVTGECLGEHEKGEAQMDRLDLKEGQELIV